ncbi:MAG: hypothetical protein ABIW76_12525 [Fibrobacteria bacterium]
MPGMDDTSYPSGLELNGSGTSRLPEAAPMYALHSSLAGWDVMTHGSLYLRYNSQNFNNAGLRDEQEFDFPNWLMIMGGREFTQGRQRLDLRTMVSLDRLTEGGNGYPLLFATGETWRGEPLVDRQHPHDLLMELAVLFSHRFSRENSAFLYLGLPGEPALGPTAYMHRPANQTNPDAIISHHNQDATHITFGVATLGWMNRQFKIDGSIFTGREPDEDRYDIDRPRFDSYSLRLAYDPTRFLSAQVSAGFLKSPEVLEPDEDLARLTASILHIHPFPGGKFLSSGLVFGGNSHLDGEMQNSFTLESEWDWNLGTTYGRLEAVQKAGEDLGITALAEKTYWANGVTVGSSIRLFRRLQMMAALGAQGTVNFPEKDLQPYYGEVPLSFEVFLKISPDIMMMGMEKEKKNSVGGHGQGTESHGNH